MSDNDRWQKWYRENKDDSNRRRIMSRIATGTIPTTQSMKRYNITREEVNATRSENDLPVMYSNRQMTQERGLNKTAQGGTLTYVQAPPTMTVAPLPNVATLSEASTSAPSTSGAATSREPETAAARVHSYLYDEKYQNLD